MERLRKIFGELRKRSNAKIAIYTKEIAPNGHPIIGYVTSDSWPHDEDQNVYPDSDGEMVWLSISDSLNSNDGKLMPVCRPEEIQIVAEFVISNGREIPQLLFDIHFPGKQ